MKKNLLSILYITILSCSPIPKVPKFVKEYESLDKRLNMLNLCAEQRGYYKKLADNLFDKGYRTSALELYIRLRKIEGIQGMEKIHKRALDENDEGTEFYKGVLNKMEREYFGKSRFIYGPEVPIYGPDIPEGYEKRKTTQPVTTEPSLSK